MKLPRRSGALLIAIFMLMTACGSPPASDVLPPGEEGDSVAEAVSPQSVRVPYDARDSLNPYTCATLQNYHVANLMFDSLVTFDPAFNVELRMARELTNEGDQWVVRLRVGLTFADGTPVTAQDVAYSCQLARAGGRYGPSLTGLTDVQTPDENTVVFVLGQPDVFFDRSLSFPVVKAGTGDLPLPVGSGRFIPPADLAPTTKNVLTANTGFYSPVENVVRVELVDAGDMESQSLGIMDKTIDLMYSDLQSELNQGLGTGYRQVSLSSLVFLGVNSQSWGFDSRMRATLSALVSRDDISRKAYMGFAAVAYSLIRPSYGGSASGTGEVGLDKLAAALDELGYAARDADGYRMAGSRRFSMRLLVNSDNKSRVYAAQLIAAGLEQAGIQIIVEQAPYETYVARIESRDYDLFLGEVKVPYNLDILAFITPFGAVGSGVVQNPALVTLYNRVKAGEAAAADLDALLRQEMPVIPVLFRRGIICFSRDFSANIVATERDIFYNIGAW